MKVFSTKILLSIFATTIVASGIVYAANITSLTQNVVTGDIIAADWFNDVKNRISTIETKVNSIPAPSAQKGEPLYVKQANFSSQAAWRTAIYTSWINYGWSAQKANESADYCNTPMMTTNAECGVHACNGSNITGTILAQRNNGCADAIYGVPGDPEGTEKCAGAPWVGIACLTN